jgi:hypothetical protein
MNIIREIGRRETDDRIDIESEIRAIFEDFIFQPLHNGVIQSLKMKVTNLLSQRLGVSVLVNVSSKENSVFLESVSIQGQVYDFVELCQVMNSKFYHLLCIGVPREIVLENFRGVLVAKKTGIL